MTFKKDHQEYYHKYHLGFFEDDYDAFGSEIQGDDYALLMGKIVHRYLELMPNSLVPDKQLIEQILFEYEIFDTTLITKFSKDVLELKNKISQSDIGKKILFA